MIRNNNFEGGTNGVAVTAVNSGGPSGDAYNNINGSAWLYSNTHPAHGAMSMGASGALGGSYVAWSGLGSITTTVFIRMYVWIAAPPTVQHWAACFAVTNLFANASWSIMFGQDGQLYSADGSGSQGAIIGAYALNQIIRVEAAVLPHPTAGTIEVRYYANPEDPINSWTYRQQRINLNTGANIDMYRIGDAGNPSTHTGVWIDDVGISDITWLGPSTYSNMQIQVPAPGFW